MYKKFLKFLEKESIFGEGYYYSRPIGVFKLRKGYFLKQDLKIINKSLKDTKVYFANNREVSFDDIYNLINACDDVITEDIYNLIQKFDEVFDEIKPISDLASEALKYNIIAIVYHTKDIMNINKGRPFTSNDILIYTANSIEKVEEMVKGKGKSDRRILGIIEVTDYTF